MWNLNLLDLHIGEHDTGSVWHTFPGCYILCIHNTINHHHLL